jgi:hypothetical protein
MDRDKWCCSRIKHYVPVDEILWGPRNIIQCRRANISLHETPSHRSIAIRYPLAFWSWPVGRNQTGLWDRLQDWNDQLDDRADDLGRRHNDTTIAVYNAFAFLNTVLNNPKQYGFKDAVSECRQQDCFWHDDLHPMSAVHKLLAQDLLAFIATM